MAKLDPEFREAVKETCKIIANEMLTKPVKLTLDQEFREAVKETCKIIANEMLTKPMKLTINEKLIQGGITVIALMVIAVIVSAACWGISWIWNQIL